MASGPYCLWILLISADMMSSASSQEIRRYLLLPRFWVLRSPFGSQSTRTMGNFTRLGEKVLFLYAREKGAGRALANGLRVSPLRSIVQGCRSSNLHFQSYL
jgi:hypothetical protein